MKRSNSYYLAVHTMNGEPLSKADYKALDSLIRQAEKIVADSDRRLLISTAKD